MSQDHVPDGKTQAHLFRLRSQARTKEIQRRSMMKKTLDFSESAMEEIEDDLNRTLHRQSAAKLSNAEQTIVALLRNNEAFQKTIDRLTDAWGEDKEKAVNFAQEVLDQTCKELDGDLGYKARATAWAQGRMAAENERPLGRPRIKKP